jgi:hypothetical protein
MPVEPTPVEHLLDAAALDHNAAPSPDMILDAVARTVGPDTEVSASEMRRRVANAVEQIEQFKRSGDAGRARQVAREVKSELRGRTGQRPPEQVVDLAEMVRSIPR